VPLVVWLPETPTQVAAERSPLLALAFMLAALVAGLHPGGTSAHDPPRSLSRHGAVGFARQSAEALTLLLAGLVIGLAELSLSNGSLNLASGSSGSGPLGADGLSASAGGRSAAGSHTWPSCCCLGPLAGWPAGGLNCVCWFSRDADTDAERDRRHRQPPRSGTSWASCPLLALTHIAG